MFKSLILVCASTVSVPDCSIDTAIDVTQGQKSASLQQCLFGGMSMIAPTAIAPGGGTYAKTVCVGKVGRRFMVADGLGG